MEQRGYNPEEEYPTKGDTMTEAERWVKQFNTPMPAGTYFLEESHCWVVPAHPEEGKSFSHS